MSYEIVEAIDIQKALSTLLAPEAGKFGNGNQAIWVEPPTPPKPGTGLHITISRFKGMIKHTPLINGQAEQHYEFRVTLIQYDRTNDGLKKLDSAINKIRLRYPRLREQSLPTREDSYPQVDFLLGFFGVVNTQIDCGCG